MVPHSTMNQFVAAALLLVALAATGTIVRPTTAQDFPTVLDAFNSPGSGFGTITLTLGIAGLAGNFSDPDLQAIILAPEDTAFFTTLANFPGASTFASSPDIASLVLQYHVLPASTPNAQLNITDGATLRTQLSAYNNATFQDASVTNLTFRLLGGNQVYVGGLGPGGTFDLNSSITAGKSRIYTLKGGLMVPPSRALTVFPDPNNLTLADALANSAQFSLINTLVQADSVLKAFVSNPDQVVTLFAPTNAAINAALQQLGTTASALAGTATARRIVLNHIVPTRAYSSSTLPTGTVTVASASSIPADTLTITTVGEGSSVSSVTVQGAGNGSPIDVVFANISGGKSVVHGISGVILPSSSNSTTATPPPPATATSSPPPAASPPSPPAAAINIVQALQQLGLTSLLSTVRLAQLESTLSNSSLAVTLLAPSNAAFTAALENYAGVGAAVTNASAAQTILAYHVLAQPSLPALATSVTLNTLLGISQVNQTGSLLNVTLNPLANGDVYAGGLAPGGVFNLGNGTKAGNATVYVIDGLLIPPSKVLQGASQPLSLNEALNTPALSILASIIRNDATLLSIVSNPDTAVTVFAPTNDVFQAFAQAQGINLSSLVGTPAARRIVLNHVIALRPFSSRSIPATQPGSPLTLPSAQAGDSLSITSTGGSSPNITVQGGGNTSPINVVAANITAGKSVVHLVNGVILPSSGPAGAPSPPAGGSNVTGSPAPLPPPPSPGGARMATAHQAAPLALTAMLGAVLAVLALA